VHSINVTKVACNVYSYRLNVTATVRCYIDVKVTSHLTRYFCSVATTSEGLPMQCGVELNVVGNPAPRSCWPCIAVGKATMGNPMRNNSWHWRAWSALAVGLHSLSTFQLSSRETDLPKPNYIPQQTEYCRAVAIYHVATGYSRFLQ